MKRFFKSISMEKFRESKIFAPAILWYEALPPDQKNTVKWALGCAALFLIFFSLYSGYSKVRMVRENIESRRLNLKELLSYEENFRNQNAILRQLEREVQKSADFSLLAALENMAQSANIGRESIESISPRQLPPGDYFIETETAVTLVRVTLKQLVNYFHHIESSKNNLMLKEVQIKPRFDNPDYLNVTFKVSAFNPKE